MNHRNISISLLVTLLLFSMGGCKSKMGLVKTGTPESADLELIRSVLQIQDSETGWEVKASVRLEFEDEKHTGLLTIRIDDDRRIWASFRSGLGIEVARAYATRDSVWVPSKLFGIKEKGAWSGAGDIIGIPLNFHIVKAVSTRQLDTGINGNRLNEPSGWRISSSGESRWMESGLNDARQSAAYKAKYKIETPGPVLREMVFDDIRHMWNIHIRYEGDDAKGIDRMSLVVIDHNQHVDMQLKVLSFEKKQETDMPFDFF